MGAGDLIDPIPGNLGLELDTDTVLLLRFDEPTGVQASDEAGNLADFALANSGGLYPTPSDTAAWASAQTWQFAPDGAITAGDLAGRDTLLQRDASVQAIWTPVHPLTGSVDPLVRRGVSGSSAERRSLSIDVDAGAGVAGVLRVRWSWEEAGGTERADAWVVVPYTPSVPLLLTCTRRWVSASEVVLTYYVGDTLLAQQTSIYGAIGGATTGTTLVGGTASGANFEGYLDELAVVSREISHAELRQTWARLTVHQPAGVASFKANSPPGAPWYRLATSGPAMVARIFGQALGYAASKAHELRETFLPDAADRDTIARWEQLVGLQVRPRAPLDARRDLVLGRLRRDNGYAPPQVREALAVPFGIEVGDAGDIELIEFSPTITDEFDTIEPERWRADPPTAWSVASNEVTVTAGASDDLTGAVEHWRLRMPIDAVAGLIVQAKLRAYSGSPPHKLATSTLVGLHLYDRGRSGSELWFGVHNTGGTLQLGWRLRVAGVLGAFTSLETASGNSYYLRVRQTAASTYELWWSEVGFEDEAGDTATIFGPPDVNSVGLGAVASAAATGETIVAWAAFTVRITNGKRAFRWYALLDPSFSPDAVAANAVIPGLKPAHTYAAAISSRSVLCDNSGSGCDRGPLGAL